MIYFLVYLAIFAFGSAIFRNIDIRNRILGIGKTFACRPGKKTMAAICAAAYIPGFLIFRIITGGILPAAALGILPAIGAYAVIDVIARIREEKEAGQITFFLMTMSKWSGIKNDLVYCLKKADEAGLGNPIGRMIRTTLGRIYSGMDPSSAFGLLENEVYGEEMRYLVKNIRFSAEKGGSLQHLFKGMEEQYFKIDEECFKRKISTLRDRIAVYMTILLVMASGIWFIGGNPAARQFYTGTFQGNMLLLGFVVLFAASVAFVLGK